MDYCFFRLKLFSNWRLDPVHDNWIKDKPPALNESLIIDVCTFYQKGLYLSGLFVLAWQIGKSFLGTGVLNLFFWEK